ncbi:MAG: DUF927 domain-containing protein, partial [Deltaproteobacteria bacterium]|nr:DUF927 domain-containing protein [Deltaproteobacteria bacterium]
LQLELLAGDGLEYRKIFMRRGLNIAPGSKARHSLSEYLQTVTPALKVLCVSKTGWHGKNYITTTESIGAESTEPIIFQSPSANFTESGKAGTLESWQQQIAKYCIGNSRLLLAVSAGFSSVIAKPLSIEGGGFHFRGRSSTGKTTALHVANSILGQPELIRRWRATDNGLEGVATSCNDSLLCLDEIEELSAKAAGSVAYMLANGSGKQRANRNGESRAAQQWRVVFLSTGEIALSDHIKAGGNTVRAGHEVRIVDLLADTGHHGIFEDLHGFDGGADLSRHLVEAAEQNHGHALEAFIKKFVENREQALKVLRPLIERIAKTITPPNADGQVQRVASRFATVAAAGELAAMWEIVPWSEGEAMEGIDACFKSWLSERGGVSSQESTEAIKQVRKFIEQHGSSRFSIRAEDKIINRAGFIKTKGDEKYYCILPVTFREDVCKGLNHKVVAEALQTHGHLLPEGDSDNGRPDRKERPPEGKSSQRVFVISESILSGEDATC